MHDHKDPEGPLAVFRRRRSPIHRRFREAAGGILLAALVGLASNFLHSGLWPVSAVVAVAVIAVAYYLHQTFRFERRAIKLFDDHFTWQDRRGELHWARYSQVEGVQRDPERRQYFVRVQGSQRGFWISPDIENFTELYRRFQAPKIPHRPLPPGRETWTGPRTFRPKQGETPVCFVLVVVFGLFSLSLFRDLEGFIFLFACFLLSLFRLLFNLFDRIEIHDDAIVHRRWMPGLTRCFPLANISGACRYDASSNGRVAIDTDYGDIRIRANYENVDELVHEAERLGAARFEQAQVMEIMPREESPVTMRVAT